MFVNFFNSFMSYIILLLLIVVVAAVATTIGITLAKRKNAKKAAVAVKDGADEK